MPLAMKPMTFFRRMNADYRGNRPAIQFTAPGLSNNGQIRLAFRQYILYNDSIKGRSEFISGISMG